MKTMQDLVADTRRLMYGSMSDQLNFLSEEVPEGSNTLKFIMDVSPIQPGMILSSGLNVYYVIATDPGTKSVTVYQSFQNSRNDMLAAGAPVMIRPRVTDFLLFTYLNDMIRSLSSPVHGLYQEGQWEVEQPDWYGVFEIPAEAADMVSMTRVSVRAWGYEDMWFEIPMTYVEWQPEMGTIRLRVPTTGRAVRFDYKAPFKAADSLTTDVEVECGLSDTMHDIPPLGAAARLLRTTENRRAQIHSQSDPRRADEVQGGLNSNAARDMKTEFEARIAQERIRLVNRNPYTLAMPR